MARKRNSRRLTHLNSEPRRYNKSTRHIRSVHAGHAGQKGGWLGAFFSGAMKVLPHLLSAGAQIGASAASGAIQAKQQEAMQKRAEARQKQQALEAEQRQMEMYGL